MERELTFMEIVQQMKKFFKHIQDAWVWINKLDDYHRNILKMKEGDSIIISDIRGLKEDLVGNVIVANWSMTDGWDIILVHDKGRAHWKQKYDGGIIKEVISIGGI